MAALYSELCRGRVSIERINDRAEKTTRRSHSELLYGSYLEDCAWLPASMGEDWRLALVGKIPIEPLVGPALQLEEPARRELIHGDGMDKMARGAQLGVWMCRTFGDRLVVSLAGSRVSTSLGLMGVLFVVVVSPILFLLQSSRVGVAVKKDLIQIAGFLGFVVVEADTGCPRVLTD